MKALVDKLIDTTRYNSEEISKQWSKAICTNPRTPSYHAIPEKKLTAQAVDFYKNLRAIYYSEKPYEEVRNFFTHYAEERYRDGIPLHESLYALIMMRRHLWLYADFQKPFITGLDKEHALEAINRTIRIFDHGIYIVSKKYFELRTS
jgi:hypothetical protein